MLWTWPHESNFCKIPFSGAGRGDYQSSLPKLDSILREWVVISTWICISPSRVPQTVRCVLSVDSNATSELWMELFLMFRLCELSSSDCEMCYECG